MYMYVQPMHGVTRVRDIESTEVKNPRHNMYNITCPLSIEAHVYIS
jgi:RNA polymerase-interacting CarD/CdnL/TRCF family regulator